MSQSEARSHRPGCRSALACSWGRSMPPISIPTYALERDLATGDAAGSARLRRSLDRRASFRRLRDHRCARKSSLPRRPNAPSTSGSAPASSRCPIIIPFIVAETMAQLDHMTRGRVMFGAGPGALPSDAKMFGLAPVDLRPRMDEALDCIVALLRGETVTKKTNWFELNEARLSVGCYSQPTMEIAVASIRSPAGAMAAGRHGAGLLVLSGVDDEFAQAPCRQLANLRRDLPPSRPCRRTARAGNSRCRCILRKAANRRARTSQYGLEKWIGYANDIVPAPNPAPRGLPIRRNGCWTMSAPSSVRRTMRLRKSSTCSKSPAASAACWCSRRTGPTGRQRNAACN